MKKGTEIDNFRVLRGAKARTETGNSLVEEHGLDGAMKITQEGTSTTHSRAKISLSAYGEL